MVPPPRSLGPATYAVGDIHGEITLLRRLLAALPLREEDTLVFLGDYLNRGEDSAATLATLRDVGRSRRVCVFLRGNHEDAWLTYLAGMRFTAEKAWNDPDGAVPVEVGQWLARTVIEHEDEHAYYVHAGLEQHCEAPTRSFPSR